MNKMFIEDKCFINPSMSNIAKIIDIFLTRSIRTHFVSQKWHNWLISNKYKNYTSFDQSANVDFDLLIT